MVDFIKIRILGDTSYLRDLEYWKDHFEARLNLNTGTVEYPYRVSSEGVTIIQFSDRVTELRCSLHKVYNLISGNGYQNHSHFTQSNMKVAIEYIENLCLLHKKPIRLVGIEIGVNIPVDEAPYRIIQRNIITHRGKSITEIDNSENDKYFTRIIRTEYDLKIYDKSLQYKLKKGLLRFEVKSKRSRNLTSRIGRIVSLHDLYSDQTLRRMAKTITHEFNGLLIVDEFTETDYANDITIRLHQYRSPRFWATMREKPAYQFNNELRRAKRLIKLCGLNTMETMLKAALSSLFLNKYSAVCNSGILIKSNYDYKYDKWHKTAFRCK